MFHFLVIYLAHPTSAAGEKKKNIKRRHLSDYFPAFGKFFGFQDTQLPFSSNIDYYFFHHVLENDISFSRFIGKFHLKPWLLSMGMMSYNKKLISLKTDVGYVPEKRFFV